MYYYCINIITQTMNKSIAATYLSQSLLNKNTLKYHTIAKLWMEKYGSNYKCISVQNNTWYEYVNNKWCLIENNEFLPRLVHRTLQCDFIEYLLYLCDSLYLSTNKNMVSKHINFITNVITLLDRKIFIKGVLGECADLAYDNNLANAENIPKAKL